MLFVFPLFGQSKGDIKLAQKFESQAYAYFDANQFELSIEKLKSAADIYKALNLIEEYSNKLQEIAACFTYLDDIENSLIFFELAEQEIINFYGDESDEHISILYTLIDEYIEAKQLKKALDCIDLIDNHLSKKSSDSADYMIFLKTAAEVLKDLHIFDDAIRYYQKLEEETKRNGGENSENLAQVIIDLSRVFIESGNCFSAIKYLSDAKTILEQIDAKGIRYANCLSNLALCEAEIGNYNNALDYYNTAVLIYADSLGVSSEQYVSAYNDIAQTYIDMGNYKKGVAIAEEVAIISKGNDNLYSTALQNLAYDYSLLGIYDRAIELDSLAIAIEKKYMSPQLDSLGKHRENYALLLNNSAYYYNQLNETEKAIDLTLQSIDIYRELYGDNYPIIATSFNNLASYYSSLGKNDEGISYAKKSLSVLSNTEGNNSFKYSVGLNNLAGYYTDSRDYLTAKELYDESLTILSESVGEDHPDYLQTKINLSLCYYDEGKYDECLDILVPTMDKLRTILSENFIWMTSSERKAFWDKFSFAFLEELPAVVDNTGKGIGYLYNALLLSKGIILNSEINLERIIKASHNNRLTSIYEDLLDHRAKLIDVEYMKDPLSIQLRDSLKILVAKEERELVALSTEFGDFTKDLYLEWNEVKEHLSKNDFAIEFIDYRKNDSDTTYYSALILGNNYDAPKRVYIGTEEEITQFSKYSSNKNAASQLYDLIWGKIYSIVPKNSNIYFSPSGVLHQMSIEYLSDIKGEKVSNRHTVCRVSSTRYLCRDNRQYGTNAALFGNLNYNLDPTLIANNSHELHEGNFMAHRGYSGAINNMSPKWDNLDNTKEEVESIAQVLEKKSYMTSLYEGEKGTEELFKSLSGQEYAIIHLATHGFFLKANEARKTSYYSRQLTDNNLINPMNRSGILFSGANHSWIGEPIPDSSEDGILLAEEIAVLDFHGTDLLILSACETGLGEISSEGVSGLQYGFKQAGVNTIVMSLWNVSDEATRIMMIRFYENIGKGLSKYDSFREAQNYLRKYDGGLYDEPEYYAAFVLLDAIR